MKETTKNNYKVTVSFAVSADSEEEAEKIVDRIKKNICRNTGDENLKIDIDKAICEEKFCNPVKVDLRDASGRLSWYRISGTASEVYKKLIDRLEDIRDDKVIGYDLYGKYKYCSKDNVSVTDFIKILACALGDIDESRDRTGFNEGCTFCGHAEQLFVGLSQINRCLLAGREAWNAFPEWCPLRQNTQKEKDNE